MNYFWFWMLFCSFNLASYSHAMQRGSIVRRMPLYITHVASSKKSAIALTTRYSTDHPIIYNKIPYRSERARLERIMTINYKSTQKPTKIEGIIDQAVTTVIPESTAVEQLTKLLTRGHKPDEPCKRRDALPLFVAVAYGLSDVVNCLLRHKASPTIISVPKKITAAHYAGFFSDNKKKNNEILKALMGHGANLDAVSAGGNRPITLCGASAVSAFTDLGAQTTGVSNEALLMHDDDHGYTYELVHVDTLSIQHKTLIYEGFARLILLTDPLYAIIQTDSDKLHALWQSQLSRMQFNYSFIQNWQHVALAAGLAKRSDVWQQAHHISNTLQGHYEESKNFSRLDF